MVFTVDCWCAGILEMVFSDCCGKGISGAVIIVSEKKNCSLPVRVASCWHAVCCCEVESIVLSMVDSIYSGEFNGNTLD